MNWAAWIQFLSQIFSQYVQEISRLPFDNPLFLTLYQDSLVSLMNTTDDDDVGCPKITKDKSSDANLTSTWRLHFELKCEPRVLRSTKTSDAGLCKPAFDASLSKSATHPTRIWVTLCSMLSTDLSNLALHFRRESEKPRISRQTQVWETPHSETPASITSNTRSASSARPVFLL